MAIYAPTIDYSATANAISTKSNIKQAGIATESSKISQQGLKISDRQLDINDNTLKLKKAQLIADTAISLTSIGANIWSAAKQKTEQAQFETAKTTALDAGVQFSEMITESILNGGTKVVQDADGQWDIQLDSGLSSWRNNQLKAIDDSDDSRAVKAWRRQSLNETYASGQSQILSGVLKQSQATIDQQYNLSISAAAKSDIATGTFDMGTSLINSRTDFSPMQKQAQQATYEKFVGSNIEQKNISTLAASQGLGAATEYAYGLEEKGYSPEEIQKFVATAKTTDSQLAAGAMETAASFMKSGLENGKTPDELYGMLEEKIKGMPEDRKKKAEEAARAVQTIMAVEAGFGMWNMDMDSVDLDHLKEQRSSIADKDGMANLAIFSGLEQTKEKFIGLYDKRIAAVEKENASYGKGLTTEQVVENQQFMDATFEKLKAGTISPATAIQAVSGISGNTPEEYKDDLYEMKLINKIKDNIVPEAYKPSVTKFMSEMESLKYGVTSNKELTDEQTGQIAQARIWTNESIASLFMNTAANTMSMDQFTKALGEIKQTFVGKSLAALESGTVVDKFSLFNDPTSLDDAIGKNQQFGAMGSSPIVLTNNGQIQWAKPEQKATYDAIASEMAEQLRSQFNISTTSAPSPLMIDGKPYPVPIFQGKGKDWENTWYFAVDQGEIFASSDGNNWQQWQKFDTVAKFKETTPVNEFFNKFRTIPVQTKKEARVQDYQDKKQELDPEGKHKQL